MDESEVPLHQGIIMFMLRAMGRTMSDELLQKWLSKFYKKLECSNPEFEDPIEKAIKSHTKKRDVKSTTNKEAKLLQGMSISSELEKSDTMRMKFKKEAKTKYDSLKQVAEDKTKLRFKK